MDKSLLKVKDVKSRLNVSTSTVYDLVAQGALRCFRIGGKGRGTIRFSEEQVAAYLKARETGGVRPPPQPPPARRQPLKHLSLD